MDVNLNNTFDVSSEWFDATFAEQGGVCAICQQPPKIKLCVDRDLVSGQVRGLLCQDCKSGIDHFKDADTIMRAGDFLKMEEKAGRYPAAGQISRRGSRPLACRRR